jgi:hypothetical protein
VFALAQPAVSVPVAHIQRAHAAASVPARDSFRGRITVAAGPHRGDHGSVSIAAVPGASGSNVRRLTITVRGGRCGSSTACVQLRGTLTGTIERLRGQLPDVGQSFQIKASGALRPFGMSTSRGSVHGTGFILRGREQMSLTFVSGAAKITLSAQSRVVRGFTSP